MKSKRIKGAVAILATMLAGVISLSACTITTTPASSDAGSKKESSAQSSDAGNNDAEPSDSVETFDLKGSSDNVVDIGTPDKKVDLDSIYRNIKYIPEMFCTEYTILGNKDKIKAYADKVGYYKYNEKAASGGGIEREITSIPYKVEGKKYKYLGDKDGVSMLYIMEAKFLDKEGESTTKKFKMTLESTAAESRILKLKEIINVKWDSEYKDIEAYEEAQLELSYKFDFKGMTLTLKSDSASLDLYTGYNDPEKDTKRSVSGFAYLAENSPVIDHIAGFFYTCSDTSSSFTVTFINDQMEDETSYYAHGQMTSDGLFTFSVPYATETKTYQFACFYLHYNGLILADSENTYLYTAKEDDFKKYKLSAILGDDADTESISAEDQKELVIAQNSILTDLEKAFEGKNIKANIDKATGRVSLDSNILFATDSSDLSKEGKSSLDDFIDVYTSVVLNDKNKDLVANIMVEGHTDTQGDHEYNQKLSEKRAESVAKYCIDKEASLKSIIKSKGYSYDHPIYKADGSVDMDASRRVVFKFILEKK